MNPTNRLKLLLSDILHNEPSSITGIRQGSSTQTSPLLTFAEHDYHPSSRLPSITAIPLSSSIVPLPPHRKSSSVKHHRQRHHIHQSDMQKQQQQQTQPLLNSSTLDDLFRALTLECEQYLAASSTSSCPTKTFSELPVPPPSTTIQTNIDSNDDDYENLHPPKVSVSNGLSSLKTSIQVMSPEKRQVVSINVSSKLTSSPIVSSSQTYPLLSTSCATTTNIPPIICHSSEEDSIDVSSSSTNRKRRRRCIRKQQILSSSIQTNSSSDERTETINEKKSTNSKRSCSTDHRQQRIKSIYDNQPISLSSQKVSTRRLPRRRDISLQQNLPISTKYYEDISSRYADNLHSPLSVLLTSSDFVDGSQQQSRRSRLELGNHQPLTLLDRMHHQFYQASPTRYNTNNSDIPAHRIPSYPVY